MPETTANLPPDDDSAPRFPVARTAHLGKLTAGMIALYVNDNSDPLMVEVGREVILGRSSPGSNTQPTIDLTAHGGYEKGVSRLHAAIRRTELGDVMLTDQSSANGTYVNGIRLAPFSPMRLKPGDAIRFGRLAVEIYFDAATDAAPKLAASETEAFSSRREHEASGIDTALLLPQTPEQAAQSRPLTTRRLSEGEGPVSAATRFQGTLSLDPAHVFTQSGALAEQVLRQLKSIEGCRINLTLEINARAPNGFDKATISLIKAICEELNFAESQFDAG